MEIRIVHDAVGLTTRSAADVVDNAIVLIHLALRQRLRTRIAVVVASKVEVDACLFDSIRQLGKILLAAASRVGVIDRNMRNQDLPVAVGCRCVLHQPILELFKLVLAARIVEHGDIDIAIFDRVPIAGKVEGLFCKSCAIAVVIRLMVSYDMQHVLVGNAIKRK